MKGNSYGALSLPAHKPADRAVEKWLIVCLMTCQASVTCLSSSLQVEGKK